MNHYLLDTNLLVALFWPAHAQHKAAIEWFASNRSQGWITCPFTQAGFVRVVSNPAFSRYSVAPLEAVGILNQNTNAKDHSFWPDAISLIEAAGHYAGRLTGHQQITDAYLLSLAIHRGGVLVTFDQSIAALLPSRSDFKRHLRILEI